MKTQTETDAIPGLRVRHNTEEPYARQIDAFVIQSFPAVAAKTKGQALDIVSDAIFASNQIRFGPKPSPESQVAIREVVRAHIDAGLPVPFMVPWGSEKPDGSGIDIAELAAFKTLLCLHDRVRIGYSPGIIASVRVEDVSAPHLFFDRADEARTQARDYTRQLRKLAELVAPGVIKITAESDKVSEEKFNTLADALLPLVQNDMLGQNDEPAVMLKEYGWIRPSAETVRHYMNSYAKLYPTKTTTDHLYILARYFTAALARKNLGLDGTLPDWKKGAFLELAFLKPVPGIDADKYLRRVHYRTLPSGYTSNHIAPWRGKGYLQIADDNSVTPKLAAFGEEREYNERTITLENGNRCAVDVRADYVFAYDFTRNSYTGLR